MPNDGFFDLRPISHMDKDGYYRVPMRIEDDGKYALITGLGQVRYFTDETLPDHIKALLAMIRSIPKDNRNRLLEGRSIAVYMNCHDRRLDDIGWQVGENMYTLVLHRKFLANLKGE
jgi:hypothetical protein